MSFESNTVNALSNDIEHEITSKENVETSTCISNATKTNIGLNIDSDKYSQLINRLSGLHEQINEYTQKRTQQISIETQNIIKKILEEIKEKQKELLLEAQVKSQQIQDTYQHDLQMKINQLNEEKAQKLADLEKTLNYEQETILKTAKDQIDSIEKDANQRKMDILQQEQQITNIQLEKLTEELVQIGKQDAVNRLSSTTTTLITSQTIPQQ